MDTPRPGLPIIASCDDCGACCRVVGMPPFRRVFDESGEDAWERLRWERPELMAALIDATRERTAGGEPSFGAPCLWFDAQTLRCKHHELRPAACRAFEIGSVDCRDVRRRGGIA